MKAALSILTLWITTHAEQGTSFDLGIPDSGTPKMAVDVTVMDPIPGEPPYLRLLKDGETTPYCQTFESIFEATSYDTTSGVYTRVGGSSVSLNSASNDCTLTKDDSNTATIECAVGGTLKLEVDSSVQIDSKGTETGAKFTVTLADYVWKSSDPNAKLVMVISFDTTCAAGSSRRLLETGAVNLALESDESGDSEEQDFGSAAFDINGKVLDKCSTSQMVSRTMVRKPNNVLHIVFNHFECTLSMDPFFGLDNELFGVVDEEEETMEVKLERRDQEWRLVVVMIVAALSCILFLLFMNLLTKKREKKRGGKGDVEMQQTQIR